MHLVRDKNPTASILFGVAVIQLVVGLVGWFVYRVNPDMDIPQLRGFLYTFQHGSFTWVDWALTFNGVIYIVLGIAARWSTVAAALLGTALYAGFLGLQVFQSGSFLTAGLIAKIPVATLLLAAIVLALRRAAAEGPPPSEGQSI
jgi:hypothetical protein